VDPIIPIPSENAVYSVVERIAMYDCFFGLPLEPAMDAIKARGLEGHLPGWYEPQTGAIDREKLQADLGLGGFLIPPHTVEYIELEQDANVPVAELPTSIGKFLNEKCPNLDFSDSDLHHHSVSWGFNHLITKYALNAAPQGDVTPLMFMYASASAYRDMGGRDFLIEHMDRAIGMIPEEIRDYERIIDTQRLQEFERYLARLPDVKIALELGDSANDERVFLFKDGIPEGIRLPSGASLI